MRFNILRETLLSKYAPSSTARKVEETLYKSRSPKVKSPSLEDLYREVHAKNVSTDHIYHNKNANEIESMMVQNRRLIESKRPFKK